MRKGITKSTGAELFYTLRGIVQGNMLPKVKALLFDLGGVIIEIHPNRIAERWAQYAKCRASDLNWSFSLDEDYQRHERGMISSREYLALLRARMDISISDTEMLDGWNQIFGDVIPGVEALLVRVGQQLPLYAFSNSNVAHEECWSARYRDVLRNFEKVFVSSTIGLRKPERQAFSHVADSIGVRPAEIAFFDDTPENVEAARDFGLHSFLISAPCDLPAAVADVIPELRAG